MFLALNLVLRKKQKFGDQVDIAIDIYYLCYEYKKNIKECNDINSVNLLYLRIKDMKGQFKKGKYDNVRYLIIFDDADILTLFLPWAWGNFTPPVTLFKISL